MNKIKFAIILGSIFFILHNNAHAELKLSKNTDENERIIKKFIPSGTTAQESIKKMTSAGLTCKIERKQTAHLHRGNVEIGQVGPIDFVWCDKQEKKGLTIRRWQVILILDKNDKITDYSVTTGLIGP